MYKGNALAIRKQGDAEHPSLYHPAGPAEILLWAPRSTPKSQPHTRLSGMIVQIYSSILLTISDQRVIIPTPNRENSVC